MSRPSDPSSESSPGDFSEKTPLTIRLEEWQRISEERMAARFERDRRKSTRGYVTMAGAIIGAFAAAYTVLGQLGITSPNGGWAWVSKAQYILDRQEDADWRRSVDQSLRTLLERTKNGRR